jgi:prophage endopeptidase
MNRTEFVIATAIILLVAFAMGWFTHWVLHRFTRVQGGDMAEMDRLAQSLHDAEELRDQALAYMEARESELTNQLVQTEAELRAAMEGLRDARHEAEEMRAYIERMHANG